MDLISTLTRLLPFGPTPPAPPREGKPETPAKMPEDRLELTREVSKTAVAKARRQAEALWYHKDPAQPEDKFRRIEADPIDVSPIPGKTIAATFFDRINGEAAELKKANAPLVETKLAGLTSAQRTQYEQVAKVVGPGPQAGLALQLLLLEGTLTAAKASDGKDLLTHLSRLAQQPVQPPLNKTALVQDMLQELALPSAINQKNRPTCAVASAQIALAGESPAEYVRLVAGLASPAGKVDMANSGRDLVREANNVGPDGTGRSDASRLLQDAFMEFANGESVTYDARNGTQSNGMSGQSAFGMSSLTNALFSRQKGEDNEDRHMAGPITPPGATPVYVPNTQAGDKRQMTAWVTRQLAQGNPVEVGMRWGQADGLGQYHAGHAVVMTQVAGDRVHYNNPWGIEESMSKAELEKRITSAHRVDAE